MYVNDKVIKSMEETLKIAGDSTRLKIMLCLFDEKERHCCCDGAIEKCVNDIALQIGASQSLVSHQLKVLKDGDFVSLRKEGTKIYYSLKDDHVRKIIKIVYEHVLEGIQND